MLRLSRLMVLVALVPVAVAWAESDAERQAREDLDRQLKSLVGTPPTKIRIDFIGLDEPNYELLEASFELDGVRLPIGDLKKLNSDGEHLIFHGDVKPGEHRLETKLHFQNTSNQVISQEGGYKWKPGSVVTFRTESGIEVEVKVTPELDRAADIKNRIKITSPATVKMLAKLDDGTMPDPLERPKAAGAEIDAGVVLKGETAAAKAAAKKAAAEEKKRLADEAKAARLAAAEEKKRAAAEALAEKKAAALAANSPRVAIVAAPVAPAPEVIDAGGPEAIDAGGGAVAVAVAVAPPSHKAEPPAPVEETGLPMPVLILLGLAGLGILLFIVARMRKKKPTDF